MEYVEVVIGVFFAVILSMIMGFFTGIIGSYLGFLFVVGAISYFFIDDIQKGAIYGALVGILAGIVSTIIMITFEFIIGGKMDLSFMSFGLSGIIIGIMVDGIICMAGGVLGSLLRL